MDKSFDLRNSAYHITPAGQNGWGMDGACWSPVLAQRAASEGPRCTRAIGDQSAPILEEV